MFILKKVDCITILKKIKTKKNLKNNAQQKKLKLPMDNKNQQVFNYTIHYQINNSEQTCSACRNEINFKLFKIDG